MGNLYRISSGPSGCPVSYTHLHQTFDILRRFVGGNHIPWAADFNSDLVLSSHQDHPFSLSFFEVFPHKIFPVCIWIYVLLLYMMTPFKVKRIWSVIFFVLYFFPVSESFFRLCAAIFTEKWIFDPLSLRISVVFSGIFLYILPELTFSFPSVSYTHLSFASWPTYFTV